MVDEDKKLVIETLNGKIDSFGLLVEKYQNTMYNLAIKIVYNNDSAKDITQESFIKAFNKLNSFDTNKSFFSWIYRITLNESLNFNKHNQFTDSMEDELPQKESSVLDKIEENEISLRIKNAIEILDDKYKSLILLKHYENLSYEEISEIVQLPVPKVKSRLYMARELLRLSLGDLQNEK